MDSIYFRKAIGMIDHTILFKNLERMRVNYYLKTLIKSFLLNREQVVSYNKSFSQTTTIRVPQGSVRTSFTHYFADDCKVYTNEIKMLCNCYCNGNYTR